MKRKDFLKVLFGGVAGLFAAKKVAAKPVLMGMDMGVGKDVTTLSLVQGKGVLKNLYYGVNGRGIIGYCEAEGVLKTLEFSNKIEGVAGIQNTDR